MNLALDHAVVCHQLDDINALGDALLGASQGGDTRQIASLRASLDRFAVAMDWQREVVVTATLAYAREHATFAEDLFAPAFILQAIAPAHPDTAPLVARLPAGIRELLHLAVTSMAATEV
jgi:hypothetical protein